MSASPIHEDNPIPGYYKRRLVRNGPWVPATIWIDGGERDPETGDLLSDETLRCLVNGRLADPYKQWTWLAGHPIKKREYDAMLKASRQAPPDSPLACPEQPVDMTVLPPITP